jgi:hypothetical protein
MADLNIFNTYSKTNCCTTITLLNQILRKEKYLMEDKSLFFFQQAEHDAKAKILEDVIMMVRNIEENAI